MIIILNGWIHLYVMRSSSWYSRYWWRTRTLFSSWNLFRRRSLFV